MKFSTFSSRIIGHRGWPARFPDNTIEGFEAAFEVVDMVETDVRRSKDGVLVLCHDPDLNGQPVAETAWSELAGLDLGGGRHPVRLDDALARFSGNRFNLEVKSLPGDPGFDGDHRLALETADRAHPDDLVSCFHWPAVDRVRIENSQVATGLLIDQGQPLIDAVRHAGQGGHAAVIAHWRSLLDHSEWVGSAHEDGLSVLAWTVNDPAMAARLIEYGVDALITDDPGAMLASFGQSPFRQASSGDG